MKFTDILGPLDFVDIRGELPESGQPVVRFFLLDEMPADTFVLARSLLIPAEKERADRLRVPARRREFTIARAILRSCLGALCGVEPSEIVLSVGDHGKPRIMLRAGCEHTGL